MKNCKNKIPKYFLSKDTGNCYKQYGDSKKTKTYYFWYSGRWAKIDFFFNFELDDNYEEISKEEIVLILY